MRTTFLLSLLALAVAGCDGEEKPEDTGGDTDCTDCDPGPTDKKTDDDSIFIMYGYMGNATIADDTDTNAPAGAKTYSGTESLYAYEEDKATFVANKSITNSSATVLCQLTWPTATSVHPSAKTIACADSASVACDFSFDVTYGTSTGTGDYCTEMFGGATFPYNGARSLGYHPNFTYSGTAIGAMFVSYYSGTSSQGPYAGWYPLTGPGRFGGSTEFLSYNTTTGDFFWDFPLFDYYQVPNPHK